MGWHGYETTDHADTRTPICQVVLDLFDMRPGGAAVSLRMGETGVSLPESREDREELAEVLQRELKVAMDASSSPSGQWPTAKVNTLERITSIGQSARYRHLCAAPAATC